jgi:hypothetical protein
MAETPGDERPPIGSRRTRLPPEAARELELGLLPLPTPEAPAPAASPRGRAAGGLVLRLPDSSLGAALAAAAAAIGELIGADTTGDADRLPLAVESRGEQALLACFVDELIELAELEGFVARRVERARLVGERLTVAVSGESISGGGSTLPRLLRGRVERAGAGWTIELELVDEARPSAPGAST